MPDEKKKKSEILINRAAVRRKVQSLGVGCAFEVFASFEQVLAEEIEKSVARAKANKRKTLKARDIVV